MKLFIFLILLTFLTEAQSTARRNFFCNELPDTIKKLRIKEIAAEDYNIDFSSLLLSFNYSSNTNTFGNFSQFVRQPFYSPSVTFISEYGFDISAIGYWIENSDDSLTGVSNEYDLSVGYNFQITKKLYIYPGYSRYFHDDKSNTLKSAFDDNFNLYIYYQSRRFINGLSANYLLGKDNTFYLSFQSSIILSKENILFRNSSLDFQPTFDINFITRSYYESNFWEILKSSSGYRDFLYDYPDIRRKFINLRNTFPNLTNLEILNIISLDYIEKKEEFTLNTIGVYFPVSHMAGNFIIDFSLLAYFPFNQPEYFNDEIQVFFDLGITYMINFKW